MKNRPIFWLLRLFKEWHKESYDKLLRTTLIILCTFSLLIIATQAHEIHGVLTGKGGLSYNYFIYYDLNTGQYLVKQFIELAIISSMTGFGLFAAFKRHRKRIVVALWLFGLLIFLIELDGFIMGMRYVPKG